VPTWDELTEPIMTAVERRAVFDPDAERAADRLALVLETQEGQLAAGGNAILAAYHWSRYLERRGSAAGVRERREGLRRYALAAADPQVAAATIGGEVAALLAEPDPAERRVLDADLEARDLLTAAQDAGDLALAREGIELLRGALTAAPPGLRAAPAAWHTLSLAWRLWHALTDDPAALEQADLALGQAGQQ
jgi:hypothetical protein